MISARHIFKSFLLSILLIAFNLHGIEPNIISLKGYLGKDEIASAQEKSEKFKDSILIEVNSTSADLLSVLDFAKRIYERKNQENLKLQVYINDNAIGPAAILPFLADELSTSVFVSWGDIPLGSENILPANILRNRVISLIPLNNPKAPLLRLMASAMTDPGFKSDEISKYPELGGSLGSTLVVNHNQLNALGIVTQVIPSDAFKSRFFPKEDKASLPAETPNVPTPGSLEDKLKKHIHYSLDSKNSIGRIVIDDRTNGINQSTWLYVRKALDYYQQKKPIFIILELNTPGGEVFAAQKISDALKEMDTQFNIPIVVYINNWAISAGAMLAYSSRFITVVNDGSMGAAEPVVTDTSGEMKTASEKVNSALRADFANRAKFFGRNPDIAEKMVDKDLILVERHGKIIKLDTESQIRTTGPDRDRVISPKGKLLTLNADQLIEFGVADLLLKPTQLVPITNEEAARGEWPASKNPIFKQDFFKDIPQAEIDTYKMDWKTYFLFILSNPVVSSLLFLGLMLGFYAEINHPGLGLPGTVAATCLFLIILSSFALEIGNWVEVILLITGLIIILVEVLVLPTFGLLGFIGIIFFLAGLFGLMLPGLGEVNFELDTKTWNAAGEAFIHRLGWLSTTFIIGLGIITLLARYVMPSFSGFRRFVLTGSEQNGYIAGEDPKKLPQKGSKGEAISSLRPSGKIMIDDKIYDAMSGGRFIDQGAPIVVVRLDGSVIIVNETGEQN